MVIQLVSQVLSRSTVSYRETILRLTREKGETETIQKLMHLFPTYIRVPEAHYGTTRHPRCLFSRTVKVVHDANCVT